MLSKIFACAMTAAVMICLVGCGSEKIAGTPDKAILAYAQIVMTGDSDNMHAAGFSDSDHKEIRFNVERAFVDSMKSVAPLSDESAKEITEIYFNKLKGAVNFNVTLKGDADRPIVDLTTTPIDQAETAKTVSANNDELFALIGMVGKLKADGATDDQLKENPDVQKLAVDALKKYVDNIQFRPEETFSVTCAKVTGSDGNVHWAPADSAAFVNFLTGRR